MLPVGGCARFCFLCSTFCLCEECSEVKREAFTKRNDEAIFMYPDLSLRSPVGAVAIYSRIESNPELNAGYFYVCVRRGVW